MPRPPPPTVVTLATAAILSLSPNTHAFHCHHPPSHRPAPLPTPLQAAQKSSGSGFGTKKPTPGGKTRAVSGHTGSGTRVLADAANNFDRLRRIHGKSATADVYVRSPLDDRSTFWFVGKVARRLPADEPAEDRDLFGRVYPTPAEAVLSQKRLILEYAKNQLRPQNLSGRYSEGLELWIAPGDSEMDVVQNKITLEKIEGSTVRGLRDGFSVKDCGYNPEIYVGEEKEKGGLRVVRDEEGRPVKPVFEIN